MPSISYSKLEKTPLTKTLERYTDALRWLKSKGLNVNATRLGKYTDHYQQLIDNWGRESFAQIAHNKNYASAIHEIHEIIEIKEKLSEFDCKEVYESLKKTASGLELYSNEVDCLKPSSARDFSFELYMARYFKRAGYTLNFNTIADFNAHDEHDSIFVECKRPAKEETIGKNIEKALKQAMKRFKVDDNRNQKGVAAIDITLLMNPNNEFMITDNISEVSKRLREADDKISPPIKRFFDKYGADCISVIFHWRLPLIHTVEECVGLYERHFSVPIFSHGTSSEQVFNRMNEKLNSSVGE